VLHTEHICVERMPQVSAATLLVRGSYAGLPGARGELEEWIGRAGFAAAGPLRMLYLQFGAEAELRVPRAFVVGNAADYLTELQLPIQAI
jgi:hypothetical protein